MNKAWKMLGALATTGALTLGSGAFAQSAATPSTDGTQQMSGDSAKQAKKQQKKERKQMKRERNQNGANGPAETSSKPQPAAGTGSQ
ncbi:hypothetical protein [Herbaspirillum robiniae]|uniref:hypothetical protein n=1 Tax=Herbaspirillum robiniae TaxID=2014887 RepID=UPI003D776354